MNDIKLTVDKAIEVAKTAGRMALEIQKQIDIVDSKDGVDVTSSADIAVENYLVAELSSNIIPGSSVICEELGERKGVNNRYTWVIDPIDGTKNFIKQNPIWSISIGLLDNGVPILGLVYMPSSNYTWYAIKGRGAFLNGRLIKCSSQTKLQKSTLWVIPPNKDSVSSQIQLFSNIIPEVYRVRAVSIGSISLCFVADGSSEGFICFIRPKTVDLVAGILIAREAGCVDNLGNFGNNKHLDINIISAPPQLFSQIATEING